ncbi:hypothetical protein EDF56_107188 [Novosphingobium sp. PhB165]|uniref:hypothetical protein n=1 Tax=Novosphingobium sp. PhB165 TaxID=2485105 RepID=UPI00104D09F5|nr:hypothetical protein [Novosphingobium sp. PhB165]TCM16609.1 hypothetical protein EDF56_107188 [Novosphingobium sp. PhB165]
MQRKARLLIVQAALAMGVFSANAHAGTLLAGTGKVEITPDAGDFPITAPREKDFVGIHDPVFARAIALGEDQDRVVLINLEVTAVPGGLDTVKSVADALGLPVSHVILFASHTHSNPLVFFHGGTPSPTQARLIERTIGGAVAAGRSALAVLQPARIGFGRGEAFVNTNNGELAGQGGIPDPHGPSDKTLNVLRVESLDGKPLALLVNYATHAK